MHSEGDHGQSGDKREFLLRDFRKNTCDPGEEGGKGCSRLRRLPIRAQRCGKASLRSWTVKYESSIKMQTVSAGRRYQRLYFSHIFCTLGCSLGDEVTLYE